MSSVRTTTAVVGQRWVVLTALVRYQEQIQAFSEYFQTAQIRNPQTDFPIYLGYVVQRAEVKQLIRGELDKYASDFKGYERIREFAIITEEFTTANDFLTPSLKLKRRKVTETYGELLEGLWS